MKLASGSASLVGKRNDYGTLKEGGCVRTEYGVVQALRDEFGDSLIYVRPTWNRQMGEQLREARELSRKRLVACLVPARMETRWWWDYCRNTEVRFIRGRIRFDGERSGAPFPSAVVIFGQPAKTTYWGEKHTPLKLFCAEEGCRPSD